MGRLTTQTDVDNYNANILSEGMQPMEVNDVISFLSETNANGNYYDKTSWSGSARLGATWWFEGSAGHWNGIDIGVQNATQVTIDTDANNPARINFFGGQGDIYRGVGGFSGRNFQIYNFDHLILDGETNSMPGFRDGWGSGRTGTFGVRVSNEIIEPSAMALKIDNQRKTMKHLEVRGYELTKGSFAQFRALLTENHMDLLLVERILATRSIRGEGLYMGQTTPFPGDNFCSIRYIIRDNLFAFTAAEAIQLQQMANGTRVYNNTIYISGHDFKSAFQTFQDTGFQMDIIQGDVEIYNNILFGHGSNGMHFFGKDGSAQGVPWGDSYVKVYNNLTGGGKKGVTYRPHNSFIYSDKGLIIQDNDIISPKRGYYDEVEDQANYYVDITDLPNGLKLSPIHLVGGTAPDDAFPYVNPGPSNEMLRSNFGTVRTNTVPEPEFVNSGFDGIDIHNITLWAELYNVGRYWGYTRTNNTGNIVDMDTLGSSITFPNMFHTDLDWVVGDDVFVIHNSSTVKSFYGKIASYTGDSVTIDNITNKVGTGTTGTGPRWNISRLRQYTSGQFCWLAEEDEVMETLLYKCLANHQAVVGAPLTRRPDNDPTRWELVWWDENGNNMYHPDYTGPFTTDFMEVAGDLRLKKNSYHNLKNRGMRCSEQPDIQTMIGWQWKQTEEGTIRDIPGAYNHKLDISEYSYLRSGRYLRSWVKRMNNSGVFFDTLYTDWQQIA